jgi:hypothetical protein
MVIGLARGEGQGTVVTIDRTDPEDVLVPVDVGEHVVYFAARDLGPVPGDLGDEREIAARVPSLHQVIGGLTEFVREFSDGLGQTDASKISLKSGCEIALESGSFVAVMGKASAKSTLKVGLEWTKP